MKIYKDGMTLMRDTASLMNAVMENKAKTINVGDTFAELMWTDRNLWVVTKVVTPRLFYARRVETYMEHWEDGTEYPKKDEKGNFLTKGPDVLFLKKRKYWYSGEYGAETKVHFSWGETTGYRDPSF